MTLIYVVSGWLLFHWLCYGILAHRLVVSDRYKRYGWPRMMIYAGAGSFVSSVMILIGFATSGGIALAIALGVAVVTFVSCQIWGKRFADPALGLPSNFLSRWGMLPPSSAIALPILGPVFALIWVGMSIGLDELIGAGKGVGQKEREKDIGYLMASIAAILLVIYISSVVSYEVYGISMYDYFFK